MPAKSRQTVSPFVAQNTIPPLENLKTEWDLETHFYKHEHDPQI